MPQSTGYEAILKLHRRGVVSTWSAADHLISLCNDAEVAGIVARLPAKLLDEVRELAARAPTTEEDWSRSLTIRSMSYNQGPLPEQDDTAQRAAHRQGVECLRRYFQASYDAELACSGAPRSAAASASRAPSVGTAAPAPRDAPHGSTDRGHSVFEHRRHTRRQAAQLLGVWVVSTALGIAMLGAFEFVLGDGRTFLWPMVGVLVMQTVLLLTPAAAYYFVNAEFVCRLDDERLQCVSPLGLLGESFEIRLDEIVGVEKRTGWKGMSSRHVVHRDGRKFWLTGSFGNPCEEFIRRIRQRTSVPEVAA